MAGGAGDAPPDRERTLIPVMMLGWRMCGIDVTCVNCHSAIYRPGKGERLCPACAWALGQDLTAIHAGLQNKAHDHAEVDGE